MFTFLKKKKKTPIFEIDSPKISLTPNTVDFISILEEFEINYTCVTNGYITFSAHVFDYAHPLMLGIHYNPLKIEFIEIFRPMEYYQQDAYDINVSFSELSEILIKKYGKPLITTSASINGYPCEQWRTADYIVNHYIMDRFGPEEHLHINFYKS